MDSGIDELRRLIAAHHDRLTQAARFPGVIQDSSDLPANKVRVFREDIRRVVIANSVIQTPDLPVWLEFRALELQVVDVRVPEGTQVFGAALPAQSQPIGGDETVTRSFTALSITEGRLEASEDPDDPMKVHTRAFAFDGGMHLGGTLNGAGNFDATAYDESVAAYVPATPGYVRWVARYFDPADASFHFAAGTPEYWPSVAYLSEATIADIPIPAGCYPVGAMALAYGQPSAAGGRFASARYFLGKREIELAQVVIDGRGFPVTDGQGHFVIGSR